MFVKYLPPGVDDQCLHDLFSPHGTIVSARVMVDPHSWKSLGYGYVNKRGGRGGEEEREEGSEWEVRAIR